MGDRVVLIQCVNFLDFFILYFNKEEGGAKGRPPLPAELANRIAHQSLTLEVSLWDANKPDFVGR